MAAATGVLVRPGLPTGLGRAAAAAVAAVLVAASMSQAVRTLDTALPALPSSPPLTAPAAAAASESLAGLPMAWVANTGQIDPAVRYLAQGMGYATFLTDTEAVVRLDGMVVRLAFDGATRSPDLSTEAPLAATVSSFAGSDPTKWQQGATTAGVVRYQHAWPGIDMTMRGTGSQLEWDLHVAAGADPTVAGMTVTGADRIDVDGDQATLVIGGSELPLAIPAVWQIRPDGTRVERDARWDLDGDTLRVIPQDWDPDLSGAIDPTLDWATYLGGGVGGGADDVGRAITVDATGTYITGTTQSHSFPTTPGAFDTVANGFDDVFVAKLDPTGSELIYSTLLGSQGSEEHSEGLVVDGAGAAYVTGSTTSGWAFPTTVGAFDRTYNGSDDVFVTKIDATGSSLAFSTLLGGTSIDQVAGIAVDASGAAYVGGHTFGPGSFPTTPGAYDRTANGSADGFITKLDANGGALVYSTLLGGAGTDFGRGIAIDGSGAASITGSASSSSANFPTTAGAYDTTHNGDVEAFVTKVDPAGASLLYSTFVGGASSDQPRGIALDPAGRAYVTGWTSSADYPTTPGAYNGGGGSRSVFVTALEPTGASLAYSTLVGPAIGTAITVDADGSAYITGSTSDAAFPTTPGAFDTSVDGTDAFVARLTPAGDELIYSTLLGGSAQDDPFDLALDAGRVHVIGRTVDGATDFPTTGGAFDETHNGEDDVFVTTLDAAGSSLVYSTLLGGPPGTGSGPDGVEAVAVDHSGVYVAGSTSSGLFPTTPGAFDTTLDGSSDVFVAKLDPTGSTLLHSTLVGGSGIDDPNGIAVDAAGNAYLIGTTNAPGFPTTPGSYDPTYDGPSTFLTMIDASGSSLVYSTFLGGGATARGVAVDGSGSAYVTGGAGSGYPTTAGAFDTTPNGGFDVYVTKVDPSGAALVYSTLIGGAAGDVGNAIAIDPGGSAYVTGVTSYHAVSYPTTAGAFATVHNDACFVFACPSREDGFVTKLDPSGSTLVYSTFLGTESHEDEVANGIAVGADGSAFVVGLGASGFPTTPGAFHSGGPGAFVTKLDPAGSGLRYSTLLSSTSFSSDSEATGVVVDSTGNAYVTGTVLGVVTTGGVEIRFPVTTDIDKADYAGRSVFLSQLDAAGSNLIFSTLVGKHGQSQSGGIARAPDGQIVIAGSTTSGDLPTTSGTFDPTNGQGVTAGFVSVFDLSLPPPVTPSGCTSAVTPAAVIGWYPANPGSPSSLQVACVLANNPGSSQVVPAFTVHDVNVAQWHNGAGRRVKSLGALAAGVSSIQLDTSSNGIAGVAGWENRPITGPGVAAGTFVKRVNGSGVATLSRPTVGTIAAGATFTLENAHARRLEDASGAPGSTTLTAPSGNFTAADVGLSISGTGIARGTTIASVTTLTQVVLSAPATLTSPVVHLGETLITTSTRQVTGATTVTAVRIGSTAAGFAASDAGLRVSGVCDNGPDPDYVIPANVYIATPPSGSEAATTGGLAVGQTGCTMTIGDPSATAPLDEEPMAEQLLQLDLHPSVVPGSDACANDQPEGLALVGTWRNPGSFEGTGISNAQPGSSSGTPTKALGQISFTLGAVGWSAFVIERPASHPGDPTPAAHYDIQFPFLPTATIMCPGTATSPGLGLSLVFEPITASQSGAAFGTGRPGTNQVRAIRQTASGGYTATAHLTSDSGLTFSPVNNFRRLCIYPTGTPNPISFQCGSG